MVRRATEGTGEAAYQRLARRTEEAQAQARRDQAEANERVEALFDNMLGEVRELRRDVQGLTHDQGMVARRMDDLELQINMTRDEVQKRALNPAPSQIASAKKAIRETAKSPAGIVAAVCIFITTVSAAGGGIPKLVQGAERFWQFLAGREVAAISRPLREPVKVPEK